MKKITKLISIALCVILCTGIFAGCGKNSEETTKTTDGKNFTYWTVLNNDVMSAGLKSYNELLLFQELEKRTGVHIDFLHPIEGSTGNEAFMTMISSSERPDMIQYYWGAYIGGPEQAIEDEVIVCLNDYLEEHAPNYYDYLEGEKGKNGHVYYGRSGLCLETQFYPNTANEPSFPSAVFGPEKPYESTTVYRFA